MSGVVAAHPYVGRGPCISTPMPRNFSRGVQVSMVAGPVGRTLGATDARQVEFAEANAAEGQILTLKSGTRDTRGGCCQDRALPCCAGHERVATMTR